MVEGSTKPIASTVTHAGIVKGEAIRLQHALSIVCCWENSGKHVLSASISPFDPKASSVA
jgi:hypothetical protein